MQKENVAVREMEDRRRRVWAQEYVGATEIARATFTTEAIAPTVVRTARKLGHAVVVVGDDGQTLRFLALPWPEIKA